MNAYEVIREIENGEKKSEVVDFRVGDTVRVHNKIREVRRAKLNYLRERVGKKAKIKEVIRK